MRPTSIGKAQQLVKQTGFIRTNSPKKCTYKTDERIDTAKNTSIRMITKNNFADQEYLPEALKNTPL
jgi:hypothetical protein